MNFSQPVLDFRGSPTGIDIRKVVETGILPFITTGSVHMIQVDAATPRKAPHADGGMGSYCTATPVQKGRTVQEKGAGS